MELTDLQPINSEPLHPLLTHTIMRDGWLVQARPIGEKILLVWTNGSHRTTFDKARLCFIEVRMITDGKLLHEADGNPQFLDRMINHWSTTIHTGPLPKIEADEVKFGILRTVIESHAKKPPPPPPLERKLTGKKLRLLPPDSKRRRRSPRIKD